MFPVSERQRREVELGFVDFIELDLTNHSDKSIKLYVTSTDPDLKVVLDYEEIEYLKWNNGLPIFCRTNYVSKYNENQNSFKLGKQKTIKFPLKYQTFNWTGKEGDFKIDKHVKVKFSNSDRSILLNFLFDISVYLTKDYPRITVFKDQFHPLIQTLTVPQLPNGIRTVGGLRLTTDCQFHCTDPIFRVRQFKNDMRDTSKSIVILEAITNSEQIRSQFLVFVFSDKFRCNPPVQVWNVSVVTPLTIHHCVVHRTMQTIQLGYNGDSLNRVVKCYYNPCDFIEYPPDNLMVAANEVNTLTITVKGKDPGSSVHPIQLLDVNDNTVVFAWTLILDCYKPIPDSPLPDLGSDEEITLEKVEMAVKLYLEENRHWLCGGESRHL